MLVFVERRLLNFACYVGIPEQVLLFGKARQKGSKKKEVKLKIIKETEKLLNYAATGSGLILLTCNIF